MTSLSLHDCGRRISLFVIFKEFFSISTYIVSGQIEFSKNILRDGALVFAWYFWFMSVPLIHANTKYSTSNSVNLVVCFCGRLFFHQEIFFIGDEFRRKKNFKEKTILDHFL